MKSRMGKRLMNIKTLNALLLAVVIPVSALLISCAAEELRIPIGAPINEANRKIQGSCIIAFPDNIVDRTYKIKLGKLWEARKYEINILEAYKAETHGRIRGLFSDPGTITTHKGLMLLLEETNQAPLEDTEEIEMLTSEDETEAELRDLDTIMSELKAVESGEEVRDEKDKKKSKEDLMDEALDATGIEMFEQKDLDYLLRYEDALLGMRDNRMMVSFRVRFFNWKTQELLLDKRYSGRSQYFEPFKNAKTNERKMVELLKQAFSGPMSEMTKDIYEASHNSNL